MSAGTSKGCPSNGISLVLDTFEAHRSTIDTGRLGISRWGGLPTANFLLYRQQYVRDVARRREATVSRTGV